MWTKTADGSIVDHDDKVIYFSTPRFIKDICVEGCCFICGAKPGSKPFNNEHILPDWLLSEYGLYDRTITLPNGQKMRYGSYTVPCCTDCNMLMGREIEEPVSAVLKSGLTAINDYIAAGGLLKIYVWAALIFLKTHLKDRLLRYHLDQRKGDAKIADDYNWYDLHHIHCVVRCFFTHCEIDRAVIGSFMSWPAAPYPETFDFADLNLAQTMHLRLGETALFFVFNDSGGGLMGIGPKLDRLAGPLNPVQCRELMTDLAVVNVNIKERPVYQSNINLEAQTCRIVARLPQTFELNQIDPRQKGALLLHALNNVPEGMSFLGHTRASALAAITAGEMTFLFDDDGKFIGVPFPNDDLKASAASGTP